MKKLVFTLLVLMSVTALPAEESSHERVSVERTQAVLLDLGFSADYENQAIADGSDAYLSLSPSFAVTIDKNFDLSVTIPFAMRLQNAGSLGDTPGTSFDAAVGDPAISAGYRWNINTERISLSLSFTPPLVAPLSVEKSGYSISSGRYEFGLGAAYTFITDPIILNLGINYRTRPFIAEVNGHSTVYPAIIGIQAGITQLLNSSYSMTLSASTGVNLGMSDETGVYPDRIRYDMGVNYSVNYNSAGQGWSANVRLSSMMGYVSVSLGLSYDWYLRFD